MEKETTQSSEEHILLQYFIWEVFKRTSENLKAFIKDGFGAIQCAANNLSQLHIAFAKYWFQQLAREASAKEKYNVKIKYNINNLLEVVFLHTFLVSSHTC